VVLAYHPLPRGWVGFAAEGPTVTAHRFELPESALAQPAELASRLIAPFAARIGRAERLRILPYGILRTVDFHALPFRGDVLLAAVPVAYGLDLGSPAPSQPAPERRALVVADPSEDLPAALLEADAVAAALRQGQPAWTTQILRGTEASAGEVRHALAGVDLLHYAGHGVFSGSGGWKSVLPLAGGTGLTLGDLLAFQRVPRWVVLSACDAGRSGADAPAEGLGLAHAFLLAGSREVIAATRPVGDRAAQELLTELYRRWSPAPDLAPLLRDAQLAWRRRDPAGDWQSFRLVEP
jgi:CHAT domain-containing protein